MVVVLVAVVLWGLSAPLAMASNNCVAMGAMCEGPCGALSAIPSAVPNGTMLEPARDLALPARPGLPGTLSRVLEPPPKSVPLVA